MKIGKPFGRTIKPKSSKLYEERIANAGKLPVEEPSLSPFGSLAGFVICLVLAGVFCISTNHVAVGIGLIVFGLLPAIIAVVQANSLVNAVLDGKAQFFNAPAQADSFGPQAAELFRQANKALSKAELAEAEKNREAEVEATKAWFEDAQPQFDVVDITASDGIRLVGHCLDVNPESNNWLVMAHGLGGGWKSCLGVARHFAEKGFKLLLVEMRAQGESGGKVMGAGHLERRDLIEWCQWLVAQKTPAPAGEPAEKAPQLSIVLMGQSLGAAAAIEACGEKDLPAQVKCVVSDSAFADFWNQAIFFMGSMGLNGKAVTPHPILDLVRVMFRSRKGGYDFADASAVKAIAHAQAPVLLLHGEDDQLVPPFNVERLDEAAGGAAAGENHQKVRIPSAGHCCAAGAAPEAYYGAVFSFIEKHL